MKRIKRFVKDCNPLEYWLRDVDAAYENTVGFSGWYGEWHGGLTLNSNDTQYRSKECLDSYYCEKKFGVVMVFCI